jgi:DNA polymerase-3 subunit gamma/tau
VFENIIEQGAVLQLKDDILSRKSAPSMLFFGPPESGKGSAALELARALSCEEDASWKCSCPSCERHRYLQHNDLLILGPRSFQAEISACYSAFLRNSSSSSARILFIRSLRKLQIRFSDVLMEDDPKLGKVASILQSLEEGISEFWIKSADSANSAALEKMCASLVKDSLSLSGSVSSNVPVGHIRRAAYWCRLAPNGKRKTLLIENAENMREDAGNSLLKLLEEPPDTVTIVLTSSRREAIMPTILSRLRPYRFLKRTVESEREVLRRVFQDSVNENDIAAGSSLVSAYLDSFFNRSTEKLYPLAAWFIASLARVTIHSFNKKGKSVPPVVNALGERYAPIAADAGFERSVRITAIVKPLLAASGGFEDDSFSRFLKLCLEMTGNVTREACEPQFLAYNNLFKKYIGEAETAVCVLNQNAALALEALLYRLKNALVRGENG